MDPKTSCFLMEHSPLETSWVLMDPKISCVLMDPKTSCDLMDPVKTHECWNLGQIETEISMGNHRQPRRRPKCDLEHFLGWTKDIYFIFSLEIICIYFKWKKIHSRIITWLLLYTYDNTLCVGGREIQALCKKMLEFWLIVWISLKVEWKIHLRQKSHQTFQSQ